MKHTKKLASLLLALVMVFALALPAFAEETYTITIKNATAGHTYEAYQIFAGDLSEGTLSNIEWGTGVSEAGKTALGDAKAKAETLKNEADAKAFATAVAPYLATVAGSANTLTDGEYVISGLAAGYYLVKDQDSTLTDGNDSYTNYILKVVSNVNVNPKSSVPSVQKKVKDTNDSVADSTTGWQDSADHDINDVIDYQLTATLANNVSTYAGPYKLVFTDTISKGLTYQSITSVKIQYNSGEIVIPAAAGGSNGYTATTAAYGGTETTYAGGNVLTITIDNLKAFLPEGTSATVLDSAKVVVEYKAQLNSNAVIGSAGNPNKVYLEYSNNPNKSESGENHETGKTPEDTVIVFTYQTIINKVDSENKPLTGAAFKLEKLIKGKDGAADTWTTVKEFTVDETTTSFTFSGLDDGQYKLTETKTPAGYNTIDPIYFVIEATHDATADTPALTVLKAYLTDENGNKKTEVKDGETVNIDLGTVDLTAGSITTTVVNKSGSELPSTGGIGTTIFYVLGGVLVIGAAVLLITKKRMGASK